MNPAFFAEPRTWSPVQSLLRWLAPALPHATRPAGGDASRALPSNGAWSAKPATSPCSTASGSPMSPMPPRALRVVRVMEVGQKPAQVGRMVISGRLADVCAELDRMVAREAATH